MREKSPRQRDGRLRRLGHLVNEYLTAGGLTQRSLSSLCAELWPQVVGPWYASHTRVIGLREKELSVWCETPALAQQLQYDQVTVITRLNERLGGEHLTSLRPASVGPQWQRQSLLNTPETPPTVSEAELAAIKLTEDEVAFVARAAAEIRDPALQQRYSASLARELRLRYWKLARGWRPCRRCGELHNELGDDCFPCRVAQQEPPRQGSDEILDTPWDRR